MEPDLRREFALALDPALILVRAGKPPDRWQVEFLRTRPARALLCCPGRSGSQRPSPRQRCTRPFTGPARWC
jgi:hypothetical protein